MPVSRVVTLPEDLTVRDLQRRVIGQVMLDGVPGGIRSKPAVSNSAAM